MGASKISGVGLVLFLAVGLTGCTQPDPVQVSTISATVKKLDLKSLGRIECDGVYAPDGLGSTVRYTRTIGVTGSDHLPELVSRLKRAGFKENTQETSASGGVHTYLYGPHETSATVLSKSPGSAKFGLNEDYECSVPAEGLTVLVLRPTDG
ncbi:hypothetical protein [Leifsonia poae]|uniref:hypothetical protein n=1 Tax=Leifsonia poae TaxID=110933 RepID=UPI003D67D5D4